MSTDLGKGDVVAAVSDLSVIGAWTATGRPYVVKAGQRAIVAETVHTAGACCTVCGRPPHLVGLKLEEYPLRPGVLFCPCEWRKIGGSEAETVARFAHHLTPALGRASRPRAPARVP